EGGAALLHPTGGLGSAGGPGPGGRGRPPPPRARAPPGGRTGLRRATPPRPPPRPALPHTRVSQARGVQKRSADGQPSLSSTRRAVSSPPAQRLTRLAGGPAPGAFVATGGRGGLCPPTRPLRSAASVCTCRAKCPVGGVG